VSNYPGFIRVKLSTKAPSGAVTPFDQLRLDHVDQSVSNLSNARAYNPNKRLKLKRFVFEAFLSTNELLSSSLANEKFFTSDHVVSL